MTYQLSQEGQRTYGSSYHRQPSRLTSFALGIYAALGLGGCSSDSQQQYPLAQQQAQKQTSKEACLLVYDRRDAMPGPFNKKNSIQQPSYVLLQQELQATTDSDRKKSLRAAISFLDFFGQNYSSIEIVGTTRDCSLATTASARGLFPDTIVYCIPLKNYT